MSPIHMHSAIGRFSAHAADRLLARGHRVHVLATELKFGDHEPSQPCNATITHWSKMTREEMRRDYDIVIVNIGDHYPFHAGIFWVLDQTPALGIFHDYYLYNLFRGWLWDKSRSEPPTWHDETHDRLITDIYGAAARPLAREAREGALSLEAIAKALPMTEWILRRCGGAFGHAGFYQERLRQNCAGPVGWARLPALSRQIPLVADRSGPTPEKLVALTVGIMNPNKCVDRVIEAIGRSPALSDRLDYHLAGPISPEEETRLTALANSLGYGGLRIFGQVDDAALAQHLTQADMICCLRRPVLEGASGSAVEALLAGRPTIVADAGFYAELPDEVVFKVPPDIPVEALRSHLMRLAADGALRVAAGEVSRHWAERHLNLDRYLEQLEGFVFELIEAGPRLRLGRQLGAALAGLEVSSGDDAIPRIADAVNGLLGNPSQP